MPRYTFIGSLTEQSIELKFSQAYNTTGEANSYNKDIQIFEDAMIECVVTELPETVDHQQFARTYDPYSAVVFIMVDQCNRESLTRITQWKQTIERLSLYNPEINVVITKSDLVRNHAFKMNEAMQVAKDNGIPPENVYSISSKNPEKETPEMFLEVTERVYRKYQSRNQLHAIKIESIYENDKNPGNSGKRNISCADTIAACKAIRLSSYNTIMHLMKPHNRGWSLMFKSS